MCVLSPFVLLISDPRPQSLLQTLHGQVRQAILSGREIVSLPMPRVFRRKPTKEVTVLQNRWNDNLSQYLLPRSTELEFKRSAIDGVGLFALSDLPQGMHMSITALFSTLLSRSGAERSMSAASVQRADGKRSTRLMLGPIALVNHACKDHTNAIVWGEWKGLVLTKDVQAGEEILFCYSTNFPLSCVFCE